MIKKILIYSIFLTSAFLNFSHVIAEGEWEELSPIQTARTSPASAVIDGKIYVAGGTRSWTDQITMEMYDPATDSWTYKASLSEPRVSPGFGTINGKFYVVGGRNNSWSAMNSLEIYDPATDSWSMGAPMPTARISPGVAVFDGKLFAIGGALNNSTITTVVEIYDPATNSWSTAASMPTIRGGGMAVQVIDGKIYVAGGAIESFSTMTDILEVYDPIANTWETKEPMPSTRAGSASVEFNGRMMVIGGTNEDWDSIDEIIYYDPNSDAWTTFEPLPRELHRAAAQIVDGDLYIIGGKDIDWGTANGVYKFSLSGYFSPKVLSLQPVNNISNANINTDLRISFNKDVFEGAGNIYIKKTSDDSVVETIDASSSNITGWETDTLIISLSNSLEYYTEYYIDVDGGFVIDSEGFYSSEILGKDEWSFRTQSLETVTKTIPECECYEIGSVENNYPENVHIEYSNDNQASWEYSPQDDGDKKDCSVTDIKVKYLPSAEDLTQEDLEAEFVGENNQTQIMPTGNGTIEIEKVNLTGAKTFGGTAYDTANTISIDSSGNIFTAGFFEGTADFDPGAGTDNHTSSGGYDIFITKYNADGSYGWTKTFGGTSNDNASGVSTDSSGNIFTVGYFYSGTVDFDPGAGTDNHTSSGGSDAFITKYNADGSYGWTKTFGGTAYDSANAISTDSSGNIFTAGSFQGTADFDPGAGIDSHTSTDGSYDISITKYNADGSYGWTKTFGGIVYDGANAISTDSSGNIFTVGRFQSTVDFDPGASTDNHTSSGDYDAFITKYNADGSYGSYVKAYEYYNSGTYQAIITPSEIPPAVWETFTATQSTPTGTSINYEILDETCSEILISQTTETTINLASINAETYGKLCLNATLETTDDQITPFIDKWTANYMLLATNASNTFNYSTKPDDACSPQEEPEELAINILSVKNITQTSVDIKVEVDGYEDKKLDFKIEITNKDTGKKEVVKMTEKVDGDGETILVIEDLLPDTNYSFKVKVSEKDDDDYSDYSDSKKATTQGEEDENVSTTSPIFNIPVKEYISLSEFKKNQEEQRANELQKNQEESLTQETKSEDDKKFFKETILNSSVVQNLPGVVKAAGLVAGGALALASTTVPFLPASPTPVSNSISKFLSLFGMMGKKRRKDNWGVVFDAETRRPIAGVRIDIISQNKFIESTTTDQEGRFGFLANPGAYTLQVAKDKYKLSTKDEIDELYGNLYTEKPFTINKGKMVKMSIAMQSTEIDWKDFSQKKIASYVSFWSVIKKDAAIVLFYAGLVATIIMLYYSTTILNFGIFLAYLAMLIYNLFFKTKSFGMVTNQENKPVPFAIVSFYKEEDPEKRLAFTVSDVFGRYYQLIKNGKYLMKVQGQTISGQAFSKALRVDVKDGVVREDVVV